MDLVFDNSRMINLLLDRGQAIKHKNSAKIYQLEHLINLEKAESYHSRIVGVFITYETERDIRYAQRHKVAEIFKERTSISQAKEPTNYSWENLGFSLLRRTFGLVAALSLMSLSIFIAYNIQFKMETSLHNSNTFEQFDCDLFHNSMSDDADQFEFAIPDYTQERY